MLPQHLIERALSLTGKKMEDMMEITYCSFRESDDEKEFSIEKFSYYLLSPEFIENMFYILHPWERLQILSNQYKYTAGNIWEAIYEYQLWNEEPLTNLLSKI